MRERGVAVVCALASVAGFALGVVFPRGERRPLAGSISAYVVVGVFALVLALALGRRSQ